MTRRRTRNDNLRSEAGLFLLLPLFYRSSGTIGEGVRVLAGSMNPSQPDFIFDWSYPVAFIWGLLVVASLVGWGRVLGRCLISTDDIGWGQAGALGMSTFLILSGPLLVLSIFSAKFVLLFLMAGWAFLVRQIFLSREKKEAWSIPPPTALKVTLVLLGLLVALTYAGAVAWRNYDSNDDLIAYLYLNRRVLDLGTLFDPFSLRMLGALGGQLTLSTLVTAFLPWKYTNLLDCGIAGLIVLGQAQEFVRGTNLKAWIARMCLVALALTFPMPRTNTASELTGVVLFMAFFWSLDLVATGRASGWRAAVLVGGVAAAAATLRCHNIFAEALVGAIFIIGCFGRRDQNRPAVFREALLALTFASAVLLPWLIVSYRSGGTFLYPIFKGNHQSNFEVYTVHLSFLDSLQFIGGFFASTPYIFLFLPLCFFSPGSKQRRLFALGALVLLFTIVFLSQYNMGTIIYIDAYRYLAPIAVAFGLYASGVLAQQLVASPEYPESGLSELRIKLTKIATIGIVSLQIIGFGIASIVNIKAVLWASDLRNQIWCARVGPLDTIGAERDYALAFAQIPQDSKTLVALDYPFLLDNRTHSIFNIDIPGAASPGKGLPYFQGPEAVKQYLLSHGIEYVAHVPFKSEVYMPQRICTVEWELRQHESFYQLVAKYQLDFIQNIDHLAETNSVLYSSPEIRLISLKN